MKKRLLSLILLVSLLVSAVGCGDGEKTISKAFDKKAQNAIYSEKLIAENANLRLEWDENTTGVVLTELSTGKQWGTTPIDESGEQFDELGMPILKHPQIYSVLLVNYLDFETNTAVDILSYTGAFEEGRVRCAKGKNSLMVEYYFDTPGFMIPVEYILKDSYLQIRIDPERIQEGKNKIIKISVAPFICSAKNDTENTYLFVPSGSGALVDTKTISQQGTQYSSQVYGYDLSIEKIADTSVRESVKLPVYGAKIESDKAIFAVIEDASDSAYIDVKAGASAFGYTAVYASFQIRGYTGHSAKLYDNSEIKNTVYSKRKISTPIVINYYPLTGEKANYSGMAQVYREYLSENCNMTATDTEIPLNITMLGGTMITKSFFGVPYRSLYNATTLKEAENIVKNVSENTDLPFSVVLKGFGETGVDVGKIGGGFKIADKLGSTKDIENLYKTCEESSAQLYMDFDVVRFNDSANGFSKATEVAYNAGEQKAIQYLYNMAVRSQEDGSQHFLLAPKLIETAVDKVIKTSGKIRLTGISLSTLSSLSYSDYSDKTDSLYYSKSGMSDNISSAVSKVKKNGIKFAACDANAYAAARADIIYDVPTASDKEFIFSADVPFYEMVFKGFVPMTVDSINLAQNTEELLLKAVESGCGLNYTVINEWDNNLINADYPLFYNSEFEDIAENIYSTVEKLSDYYGKTQGAYITGHEILESGLRKTEFNNGICVYVNYGEQAVISPFGEISPYDFVVGEISK